MRGIIKKVLKEEDFDWAKDVDPLYDYISWLNQNYKNTPGLPSWTNQFDEVIESFGYFSMDSATMLQHARIWEDRDQDPKRRLGALNAFESYAMMGQIIENNHLYYRYVTKYAIERDIPEEDVHEIAETLIQKGLHDVGVQGLNNR
jgi:hypothetical protein